MGDRTRGRTRGHAVLRAAAVLAVGVWIATSLSEPALTDGAPLAFEDLSLVSGGPFDLGAPISNVEKASAAWVDVDGDGWDDLIVLTGTGQAFVYRLNREGDGGGRVLVPAPAGNGLDVGTVFENDGASITAGDVDGDGDEDLFIGCAWNEAIPSGENALLLNDGSGRFTDVTEQVGLLDGNNTTAACVLFDMDLDGDLDLLTANTDLEHAGKGGDGVTHLFRNTLRESGVLRFVDETLARGVVEEGRAVWQVSALDYELDGDMDLLITHDIQGLTQLFANDGTGHFEDVTFRSGSGPGSRETRTSFGDDSPNAMGVAVGDVQNDGHLDIYLSNIAYNPLYVNNGDSTFREVAGDAECSGGRVTWGVLFQDLDLDGHVDLHVAAGDTWFMNRDVIRPWLYRNRGDGTFDEVFEQSGMRHDPPLHREAGTAAADFDGDGRVDIVVCRAVRDTGASPYLYRNTTDTTGQRWLTVLLDARRAETNGSAIGAVVRAVPRDAQGEPLAGLAQVRLVTASDSKSSRSSLAQTFGFGPDAATVDVTVTWPRAGTLEERTDSYEALDLDVRTVLRERGPVPLWRLAPIASATVAGGHAAEVALAGTGRDPALATCEVTSGPAWVQVDGFDGGTWSVSVDAPVVQVPARHLVEIESRVPSEPGTPSRQSLWLDVVPAPSIESADLRRRGRRIRLFGANFPRRETTVLVDGIPCPRVLVRRHHREEDDEGTRLVAVLPRSLRAGFASAVHVVEVVDESTGERSPPFVFEAPPR